MNRCKPACDSLGFGGHDFDCPMHTAQQQASAGGSVPYRAWKRAAELTGPNRSSSEVLEAFARYIAAHEPAPVDPFDDLANEIIALLGDTPMRQHTAAVAALLRARVTVAKGGE